MITIIIAVLGTLAFDWGIAFLKNYNKKKQKKRDVDLFFFKLEQMLQDKNVAYEDKIEKAKELCRMTKGEYASGAYIALESINL